MTIPTLLTLEEFREIIGLHPYYFWQIGEGVPASSRGDCQSVMFQYAWQDSGQLAREEVADCIAQAEQMFANIAGYWPAPKFIISEQHDYPQHYQANLYSGYGTPRGQYKAVKLKWGYLQNIGTEELTLVNASVNVTFSDPDGDGVNERFTATVTVPSGTLTGEVAAFFRAADRNDLELAGWEICPITVSISGTTCTITGKSILLVKPDNVLGLDPESLSADPSDEGNTFVSAISVYRRTVNVEDTGSLIWERYNCDTPPCAVEIGTGCFGVRNKELGWVTPQPARYDSDTSQFIHAYPDCICRAPDRVTVNYLAGYPRQSNGKMDRTHARIIALLSAALLPNQKCGCDRADQRLFFYRSLPSDGEQNQYFDDPTPFGRNQGAIEAWKLAQPLMQGAGAMYG